MSTPEGGTRSVGPLANPRRVRWSALTRGAAGLAAAGVLTGGAIIGGGTADLSPRDATVAHVVPVLWPIHPAESDEGVVDAATDDATS